MEHWQSGIVYLKINDVEIPVEPHKGYEVDYRDCENIVETEGGTITRDVVRMNIPTINVSYDCDKSMLMQIKNFKNMFFLDVKFYEPSNVPDEEYNLRNVRMYMTNYKEKLLADVLAGGIWRVSFTLNYMEDITNG